MDISRLSEAKIEDLLRSGHEADALRAHFGKPLYDELSALAKAERGPSAQVNRARGTKVYILPGIMGSKLSVQDGDDDNLIWLNPIALGFGRVQDLAWGQAPGKVFASGVLYSAYLRMKYRLRWAGLDPEFLPYDWRAGIDASAEAALEQVSRGPKPYVLVCHSMGGLLARKLASMTTAQDLPHVITIGTPNLGSYSPVTAMRLTHEYVRLLGRLDPNDGPKDLVEKYLSRFPGLLEMLPSPTRREDELYFDQDWWPQESGVVPRGSALEAALDAQASLPEPDGRFHQIIGIGQKTIVRAEKADGRLVYRMSEDGDGTVPRDLAEFGDVAGRYYYPGGHAWLCNRLAIIRAVDDIVSDGTTNRLDTALPDVKRGTAETTEEDLLAAAKARVPASREQALKIVDEALLMSNFASSEGADFDEEDVPVNASAMSPAENQGGPPDGGGPLVAASAEEPAPVPAPGNPGALQKRSFSYFMSEESRRRLVVGLGCGNILDVAADAYVLGVFEGVNSLGGAAGVVDLALDGALRKMIEDNQITGRRGEVTFLPVPRYVLRTSHIVVVGLGALGVPEEIERAVNLAGRNLMRMLSIANVTSVATVLWGASSGLHPLKTFDALFTGLFESLLQWDTQQEFNAITFCELDQGKCLEAADHLSTVFARLKVPNCEIILNISEIAAPRLAIARSGESAAPSAYPDVLTVRGELDRDQLVLTASFVAGGGIDSSAGVPLSPKPFHLSDLDTIIRHLEHADKDDLRSLSDDLIELVFTKELRAHLDLKPERQLIVVTDPWGSRVPWEVLHADGEPIALNGGLHRRYLAVGQPVARSTPPRLTWRQTRAARMQMLLVSNPTVDLKGAEKEAKNIRETVEDLHSDYRMTELNQADATVEAVLSALRDTDASIDLFHYAGHAFFDPEDRARSGLNLSDGNLTGVQIGNLLTLPRVVFLNACESGRVRRKRGEEDTEDATRATDFAVRNVGLTEALILGGVSQIIGTFWPVGDYEAYRFAGEFYRQVAEKPIGPAVTEARKLIAKDSASWVNYIHYGEPSGEV